MLRKKKRKKHGRKSDGTHYKRWMDERGDKSRSQEQDKRDILKKHAAHMQHLSLCVRI